MSRARRVCARTQQWPKGKTPQIMKRMYADPSVHMHIMSCCSWPPITTQREGLSLRGHNKWRIAITDICRAIEITIKNRTKQHAKRGQQRSGRGTAAPEPVDARPSCLFFFLNIFFSLFSEFDGFLFFFYHVCQHEHYTPIEIRAQTLVVVFRVQKEGSRNHGDVYSRATSPLSPPLARGSVHAQVRRVYVREERSHLFSPPPHSEASIRAARSSARRASFSSLSLSCFSLSSARARF